eukprot:1637289-Prymnesium_polylepis.1
MLRPTLLGNRAQARLAGERPQEAVADCGAALALDAENVKLLLRRAAAYMSLKQPAAARADYERVLDLEPDNGTAAEFVAAAEAEAAADGGRGGAGGGGDADEEPELDPYEIIGVARDASGADIKKAFLKGALRYHPDKQANASAEERAAAELRFIQLNLANDVLSDPIKKQQYDVGGSFSELSGGARRKGGGRARGADGA